MLAAQTVPTGIINPHRGNFSVQVSPAAASVFTGELATSTVTVTPIQGFDSPVQLSCDALPANTVCQFTPDTIANGNGTSALTIQTSAPQPSARSRTPAMAVSATLALGMILPFLRLSPLRRYGVLFLTLCLLPLMSCGTQPSADTGGTPAGTYGVAVIGVGGPSGETLVNSAVFALTVKSLF